MARFKTTLNFVIVFSALWGLVFVIGCGGSAEKQAVSDLLQQYSRTVDEYSSADQSKKAEIEKKLSEGYRICQKESLDIADEFESVDLEGWDDQY